MLPRDDDYRAMAEECVRRARESESEQDRQGYLVRLVMASNSSTDTKGRREATLARQDSYHNLSGSFRVNFCCVRYRSALSASQCGSNSPALAFSMMCLAMIARPILA